MTAYLYNLQAQREMGVNQAIPFLQRNKEERLLQYLPALFSTPEDLIYVDELPSSEYLSLLEEKGFLPGQFVLIPPHGGSIEHPKLELWCASLSGTSLHKNGIFPDWDIVKIANSKIETLSLWCAPGIKIETKEDLHAGFDQIGFPCIIKSEHGFSARGNTMIARETKAKLEPPILQLLEKKERFILEPYFTRVFDFSSQWVLQKQHDPQLLGSTICINDANGRYLSSIALPDDHLFQKSNAFKTHLHIAKDALRNLLNRGYFGPVGIDAFAFRDRSNEIQTHPLVEINARQTMGSVALALQRRYFRNALLKIQFEKNQLSGLLPKMETPFNLQYSVLESLPSFVTANISA